MASNEEEIKMLETRQVRDVRRLQGKYGCWRKHTGQEDGDERLWTVKHEYWGRK